MNMAPPLDKKYSPAQSSPFQPSSSTCKCSVSLLLVQAIDLIDPPPSSVDQIENDNFEDCVGGDGDGQENNIDNGLDKNTTEANNGVEESSRVIAPVSDGNSHDILTGEAPTTYTTTKKVRFSKSCVQRKIVSAQDAIQAFDNLIHAASLSTPHLTQNESQSTMPDDGRGKTSISAITGGVDRLDISWESLQQSADIYRALLITSCLLLELLPPYASSSMTGITANAKEINESKCTENNPQPPNTIMNNNIQLQYSCQRKCPLSFTNPSCIPELSPTIKKKILSTSRRCILLLRSLEKICAAKTIAERHTFSSTQSNTPTTATNMANKSFQSIQNQNFHSTTFYSGGDDIHDYDRSIADLYSNYDWHDDGFLPLAFSRNNHHTSCDESVGTTSNSDDYFQAKHANKPSILQECCYRPHNFTDPPSSKFEKCAWTRDWNRGERIISLRLEDYIYHDEGGYFPDIVGDFENNYVEERETEGMEETAESQWMQLNLHDNGEVTVADDNVESSSACMVDESIIDGNKSTISSLVQNNAHDTKVGGLTHDNNDDEVDDLTNNNENEDNPFFNLSPKALQIEEENLWSIMFPGESSSSPISAPPNDNGKYQGHHNINSDSREAGKGKRFSSKRRNRKKRLRTKRRRILKKKEANLSTAAKSVSESCPINDEETVEDDIDDDGDEINDEINQDSENAGASSEPIVYAKEGFLLLVRSENSMLDQAAKFDLNLSNNEPHRNSEDTPTTNQSRVYVRLHPSGWLSIEDRSVCHRGINPTTDDNGNESEEYQKTSYTAGKEFAVSSKGTPEHNVVPGQSQFSKQNFTEMSPISKRIRYLDYFIGSRTVCQPCVPKGLESFHFRLDGIRLLGASSLNSYCEANQTSETSAGHASSLLFCVDDATGTFMDGYDWVCALSGAASNANALQKNIQSEWTDEIKRMIK